MGRLKWTEKKIAEWEKEGYGKGSGPEYKPWLEVGDFSSMGRSRRIYGLKTGRVHHTFSDTEYGLFLACEWSRSVVDIREQYPLDRGLTQTVASELKIRHPFYPGTHVPTVMTVDFLVTIVKDGAEHFMAMNAKRDEEAEDEVSLHKLEIQRTYFELLGTPHHLIYHSQIPQQKVKNLAWIRDAQVKDGEIEPSEGYYAALASRMGRELQAPVDTNVPLAAYCQTFDARHGLEPGAGLRVARLLMQERALMVDLNSKDLTREPVGAFLMSSRAGQLRAVGGA
nr:TnsA endonuclease N-terminal domain-containing protein [uncultured Rhodoferax sp.]